MTLLGQASFFRVNPYQSAFPFHHTACDQAQRASLYLRHRRRGIDVPVATGLHHNRGSVRSVRVLSFVFVFPWNTRGVWHTVVATRSNAAACRYVKKPSFVNRPPTRTLNRVPRHIGIVQGVTSQFHQFSNCLTVAHCQKRYSLVSVVRRCEELRIQKLSMGVCCTVSVG